MAAKKIMTVEEIGTKVLGQKALEAYKFAIATKPAKNDENLKKFVAERNAFTDEFREIYELQKWAEQLSISLKAALKKVYGEGPEDMLSANVKWGKQTYTYSFIGDGPLPIAKDLIAKGEVTEDQLFEAITVSAMAKAAGFFVEKLMDRYPKNITAIPRERVLNIK